MPTFRENRAAVDDRLILDTVRSLETRVAVSAAVAAHALGTTESVLQPSLERLLMEGALRTSELRCRAHAGVDFTTRCVWFHTPALEVTARFGPVSERPRPGVPEPDAHTPALAS